MVIVSLLFFRNTFISFSSYVGEDVSHWISKVQEKAIKFLSILLNYMNELSNVKNKSKFDADLSAAW